MMKRFEITTHNTEENTDDRENIDENIDIDENTNVNNHWRKTQVKDVNLNNIAGMEEREVCLSALTFSIFHDNHDFQCHFGCSIS